MKTVGGGVSIGGGVWLKVRRKKREAEEREKRAGGQVTVGEK